MSDVRYSVLGAPVDAVDMAGALAAVDRHIRTAATAGYVLAVNPEKVYVLRENAFLKAFFEKATLLIPDGIGLVRALRVLHGVKVTRVPGVDLMQEICAVSAEKEYKLFIYGAQEEVSSGAVEILEQRFPGIHIVGRANGYVTPEQMPALTQQINDSGAQILFVALGSPRQEQWIHDHIDRLTTVRICQGIGGTLDTITGHVRRAPRFWQRLGLEWFYRLACQPWRVGRQLRLLRFIGEVLKTKLTGP